jgi:DNA-binding transcriptional ArsR family regulator
MKPPRNDISYFLVSLLKAKPRTTAQLATITEMTDQTVARHLRAMRDHHLITREYPGPVYTWNK